MRVTHGICYIRGSVGVIKGGPQDVKSELEIIAKVLRTRPNINDVIIDCTMRS